ncbi:hypothetical protein NEMBOFW57_007831 [Staphylotrichum longicolle]|uniref:Pre-mRNA polyadenylation factor Fip1 domain-containing protein n=1 Tax=Staphylotrichum longicolle TaxID=669026 RepID=A0AAD4HZG6_9PEZI|nr:hypothetical protein NEMBOFW57_007831 [Staphylotrichum longicolle]
MDIDDDDDFYAPEEPEVPTTQQNPAEAPATAAATAASAKKDAADELEEGEEEDEGGAMDEDEDSQQQQQQHPAVSTSKIDVHAIPIHTPTGKPLTQVNIDEDLAEHAKPWRKPGTDLSDYFNYGFDEFTWALYAQKQEALRGEYNPDVIAQSNKKMMEDMTNMMMMGGLGMPGAAGGAGTGGGAAGAGGGAGAGGAGAQGMPGMEGMPPEMQAMMQQMMAGGMDPSQMDMAAMAGMFGGGAGGAGQGGGQGKGFGGGFGGGQGQGYGGYEQQMGGGGGGGREGGAGGGGGREREKRGRDTPYNITGWNRAPHVARMKLWSDGMTASGMPSRQFEFKLLFCSWR